MDNFVKIIKDHGDYVPFLYKVAGKMKSHEFDESDVDIMIYNMNDIKSLANVGNVLQHKVNMLTVKRNDQL